MVLWAFRTLKFRIVKIEVPEACNVTLEIIHFIKTMEDLCEALVNAFPEIKSDVGFCEASAPQINKSLFGPSIFSFPLQNYFATKSFPACTCMGGTETGIKLNFMAKERVILKSF